METKYSNSKNPGYSLKEIEVSKSIRNLLKFIGEDPEREGLLETPDRMIRAWKTLFFGYSQNPEEILKKSFTEGACDEMIIVKNIEFHTSCYRT